jgi:hypothetical protein
LIPELFQGIAIELLPILSLSFSRHGAQKQANMEDKQIEGRDNKEILAEQAKDRADPSDDADVVDVQSHPQSQTIHDEIPALSSSTVIPGPLDARYPMLPFCDRADL